MFSQTDEIAGDAHEHGGAGVVPRLGVAERLGQLLPEHDGVDGGDLQRCTPFPRPLASTMWGSIPEVGSGKLEVGNISLVRQCLSC